jgi:hypothetical protein
MYTDYYIFCDILVCRVVTVYGFNWISVRISESGPSNDSLI